MAGDSKALVKKEGGNRKERRANEKSKVDNTHRRTWDKEDYEERAAAREKVGFAFLIGLKARRMYVTSGRFMSSPSSASAGRARRRRERHRCQAQEKAGCVDLSSTFRPSCKHCTHGYLGDGGLDSTAPCFSVNQG